MFRFLSMILAGVVTSLFYFPILLRFFLPTVNTKLMLSVVGLILFFLDLTRTRAGKIDRSLFTLFGWSLAVSFMGFLSVTYNNTTDYSYAGYVVSMCVWLFAAYTVIRVLYWAFDDVTPGIIVSMLTAVCVFQCCSAIMIDKVTWFKEFADTYFDLGQSTIDKLIGVKRKYGLGALLDVAGTRFSAVLIMISVYLTKADSQKLKKWGWAYVLAFAFICIEGNIIARTTTIGMGIGILYGGFHILHKGTLREVWDNTVLKWAMVIVLVGSALLTVQYNRSETFREDLRFGFEGFFSLAEQHEWIVSSNERLRNMYVFPDNVKTWVIGDGYFDNPINTDLYFVGKLTGGYYQGTDMGYSRFLFYFGLLGTMSFVLFILTCANLCSYYHPQYRILFYVLAFANYVMWLKVATDIFVAFAPFLALHIYKKQLREKEEEVPVVK